MISNKMILYMTAAVLLGMVVLFLLNVKNMVTGQDQGLQTYIKYNDVKGISVVYKKKPYTLNFAQQNELITYLNQSIPFELGTQVRQSPQIDQIIIYQFGKNSADVITPIAFVNNQLVYSIPAWNTKGYLTEMSQGRLQKLLLETYDH